MGGMITIICVLRSGGVYTDKYVINLKKALDRILSGIRDDWKLVCFTDMKIIAPGVEVIPLEKGWKGWWSKLEVFRLDGPCLYFDLDTVLVKDISPLMDAVLNLTYDEFLMLEPFNQNEKWASGVMGWNGDYKLILDEFNPAEDMVGWDQRYISRKLNDLGAMVDSIQNRIKGVYSYKHHCKGTLPPNSTIVCFHGNPRPHILTWLKWVKRFWAHEA